MELDYEKRLAYSPRKLEGPDRMIPPRANARWQLNFDASPREQNENVYSCLLRNELLGENIEDVKQSTPPQRLFNYHNRYNKHDPNQVRIRTQDAGRYRFKLSVTRWQLCERRCQPDNSHANANGTYYNNRVIKLLPKWYLLSPKISEVPFSIDCFSAPHLVEAQLLR